MQNHTAEKLPLKSSTNTTVTCNQ